LFGPAEQPFRGPAAITIAGDELELIANDNGRPQTYRYPTSLPASKDAPPVVPPKPASFASMRWPGCALAAGFAYCPAQGGAIVRSRLGEHGGSSEAKEIARPRASGRISAAPLGAGHAVVAFLDQRMTTEGKMLQAFAAFDDKEPVRLSEDGAGATVVHFLARGQGAVAMYLDARTAMVPLHARPVSLRGSEMALGPDVVAFVGGSPERGIDFAVASAGAKGFALVPMSRETIDFGMAAVPIEDPPKEDVSPVWSRYPNGLDPAPIAATAAKDGKGAFVARVRPREKEASSPRILELGRVDGAGAFTSFGEIASGKGVTDLGIVEDQAGALWIVYGDNTVTWLERRLCAGGK
jgi:hypothetical protein